MDHKAAGLISIDIIGVQANAYEQEKVDWLIQNCPTCIQIFQGLCKVYAERPMFGFCMPGSDEWQTISYKQVYERVVHFAAGACLVPQQGCQYMSLCHGVYSPKSDNSDIAAISTATTLDIERGMARSD